MFKWVKLCRRKNSKKEHRENKKYIKSAQSRSRSQCFINAEGTLMKHLLYHTHTREHTHTHTEYVLCVSSLAC